jgi:acyl-CoA hydrolase/GNAT superfamily N-acetyltransferase
MRHDLIDPEWKSRYAEKVVDVSLALGKIRPGSRIFIGSGCAEPRYLIGALMQRAADFPDTELINILTMSVSPYTEEKYSDSFRLNAFFIGDNVRQAVWKGRADYTPMFLSELPLLFRSGQIHIDAALVQVTPPDRYGYSSMGISVDIGMAAIEAADYVVAQVNPMMPRTHGDTFVPMSWLDAIVDHEEPLIVLPAAPDDEVSRAIGRHIAHLIEDGSTLQVGIGAIPDAVLGELTHHRDMGVHTEMLSDGVMDLIKAGVITNEKKTIHKGKVIASFCMGSQALYDFIDDNPMFEMHPSEYTNNPFIIGQNARMIAINSALQVDLTGQVCSDSLGHKFYSGIGGQVDFIRGAAMSKGGKPIIALPSTAEEGKISRIVATLEEGAGVVTTRGDVHYVVTEYGAAYLHGKSIRERALSLIAIAHPSARDWLLEKAKEKGYVYPDQIITEAVYPAQYERRETFDGKLEVFFRPVKATDEKGIQRLFYSLSPRSRYLRFFTAMTSFPHRRAQELAVIDYSRDMAIVGIVRVKDDEEEEHEEIVAAGQYMIDRRSGMAEVAVMVSDAYHKLGVGTYLIRYLAQIAKENGVKGFSADVLSENKAMLQIFLKSGYNVHLEQDGADVHLYFTFDKSEGEAQPRPPTL